MEDCTEPENELIEAIASLVTYNWKDEETDYSTLEEGNSREGHIFKDIMLIRKWLEDVHGYPHWEPWIINPGEGS